MNEVITIYDSDDTEEYDADAALTAVNAASTDNFFNELPEISNDEFNRILKRLQPRDVADDVQNKRRKTVQLPGTAVASLPSSSSTATAAYTQTMTTIRGRKVIINRHQKYATIEQEIADSLNVNIAAAIEGEFDDRFYQNRPVIPFLQCMAG